MGGIAGHTPIQQQIYGRMAPNLSFGAAGVSPTITTFGAASGSLIGDMRNVSTIDPSSMSAAAQIIAAAVKDAIRDGMKSGRSSGVNGPGITNTNAFKSGVGLGGNG
jgi:hypothetical protein